jgi:hypothetical protein
MVHRTILAVLLVTLVASVSVAIPQEKSAEKAVASEKVTPADPVDVIVRGEKIGDSPVVSLETIAEDPGKYQDKKIIVEGTIETVCQTKGCWMTLVPVEGMAPVRVTFQNYGFFVPKDASGLKVRAEGKIKLTELSKEDVDHLKEDGHQIKCNHDGTANEIGFVASAVEIYKKTGDQ